MKYKQCLKKNLVRGVFVTLAVFSGSAAALAETCFQDVASFETVKTQLPNLLQTYPLYTTHQSFQVKGGFEIVENGNNFEIEAHLKPIIGSAYNNSATFTQACLNGNQLQVTLNNNTSYIITVNDSSFDIQGYEFKETDPASYEAFVSKVGNFEMDFY